MNSTQDSFGNNRRVAKEALEHVCFGSGVMRAADCYSPAFVDHVNGMEFYGLAGVETICGPVSIRLVRFADYGADQLVDGGRVASRFVVFGTFRGRHMRPLSDPPLVESGFRCQLTAR
jgi:hypothetical protein